MHTEAQPPEAELSRTLGLAATVGRRRQLWVWLTLLTVAAVAAGGAFAYRAYRTTPPRFQIVNAQRGDLTVMVTATGTLQPVTTVDVGSEVSGRIQAVYVDFNDRVKRGQVLAALDTELFEARVVQAQATLAVAQASLKEAEATEFEARLRNERTQKLAQGDAISQQELEAAQAAALRADASQARARAQVLLAKAALSADELNLQKARIRSPIDGIVISRNVEPGQTVAAAFQTPVVFKLAEDLTRMQLHVDIDEADVGQTAAGQSATFTVDAYPDRQFPAQLTLVRNAPRSVQGVVTYEGILQVDNSALLLRPGMTATAEIKTATRKDVLLVPNGALRFTPPEVVKPGASTEPAPAADGGRGRVWTLRGDRPVALAVKLGLTDKRMTEVLGGEVQAGVPLLVDTLVPGK